MILLGDLNVAPLELDVWSHKQMLRVVSHTPIECEKLVSAQKSGGWVDAMRMLVPEPERLFTWWSYRSPDWATADKGRRLDHVWVAPALADRVAGCRCSSRRAAGGARPITCRSPRRSSYKVARPTWQPPNPSVARARMTLKASVIINTHNQPEYLEGCLRALVHQSIAHCDYEIIVVDNSSSRYRDDNHRIVDRIAQDNNELTLRYVYDDVMGGLTHSRNLAVMMAATNVTVQADDDSLPCIDYVATAVSALSQSDVALNQGRDG